LFHAPRTRICGIELERLAYFGGRGTELVRSQVEPRQYQMRGHIRRQSQGLLRFLASGLGVATVLANLSQAGMGEGG
jgi:hypothetical protein